MQSYYRWRKEYGGLKLDQGKRLKKLEKENSVTSIASSLSPSYLLSSSDLCPGLTGHRAVR